MMLELIQTIVLFIGVVLLCGIFTSLLIVARNVQNNFQNVRDIKIEIVGKLDEINKKVVDIEDRLVQIDRDIVEGNHNNH